MLNQLMLETILYDNHILENKYFLQILDMLLDFFVLIHYNILVIE